MFYFPFMCFYCLYVYVCAPHARLIFPEVRGGRYPMELELQTVVSRHMGAGNPTHAASAAGRL